MGEGHDDEEMEGILTSRCREAEAEPEADPEPAPRPERAKPRYCFAVRSSRLHLSSRSSMARIAIGKALNFVFLHQ